MECAAQNGGRAAGAREIHFRHHRGASGAADDRVALPALRSAADPGQSDSGTAETDRRNRGSQDRAGGAERHRAGGRRRHARRPVFAGADAGIFRRQGSGNRGGTGAGAFRLEQCRRARRAGRGAAGKPPRTGDHHHQPAGDAGPQPRNLV
ncbi:hypothetical protein SDC9_190102 [bioreactor metagenome]|uniref:Uncharacterized protein n=1 Tax=bioreactor metagenome TaxID=1076179 RepID=A0A645HU14_9ZZZZ